jgi:plasmid maintenance system antidote protein VapI
MENLEIVNQSVEIGKRLKEYFDRLGYTQQYIADKLGVSQAAVSALLNGKPFGKKLANKWAETFELKPNWLLTGEGEMLRCNVNEVNGNGNTSVAGNGNQITTANIAEMLELQKGYQEMIKTGQAQLSESQSQINRLIAIIEQHNKENSNV